MIDFQIVKALRALRDAIVRPERSCGDTNLRAVAVFAVAVLGVAIVNTIAAGVLQDQPELVAQMKLWHPTGQNELEMPAEHQLFTARFGGALMSAIVSTLGLSGLLLVLVRFMTDVRVGFRDCVKAVSAAAGINIIGTVVSTVLQLTFQSVQAGPHLGWLVSLESSTYLAAWLQRVNGVGLWEYVAAAVGLVVSQGLHARFGYVVGATAWVVSLIVFAGYSVLAWVVSLGS